MVPQYAKEILQFTALPLFLGAQAGAMFGILTIPRGHFTTNEEKRDWIFTCGVGGASLALFLKVQLCADEFLPRQILTLARCLIVASIIGYDTYHHGFQNALQMKSIAILGIAIDLLFVN